MAGLPAAPMDGTWVVHVASYLDAFASLSPPSSYKARHTLPCVRGPSSSASGGMSTTLSNCSYDYDESANLGEAIINANFATHIYSTYACTPFKWEYGINLVCVLVWLVLARWLYDGYMRLRASSYGFLTLADALTKKDNPALAIDFASFLLSICIIARGSLYDLQPGIETGRCAAGRTPRAPVCPPTPHPSPLSIPMPKPRPRRAICLRPSILHYRRYFAAFFIYQAIGVCALVLACVTNDKLMLRKVNNVKAMVADASVAVSCVQAGSTVSTALIFAASSSGISNDFGAGILGAVIYWLIGQVYRQCPYVIK